MKNYDPSTIADEVFKIVVRGDERKYYRVGRAGQWYGGISTADCCGCNLKCVFCWSDKPRDNIETIGSFYTPQQVFEKITATARAHNYRLLRVSGNEPTIAKKHLLKLLSMVEKKQYTFILETNGTLLDEQLIQDLSRFRNVYVRVSLKGSHEEEFALLTGAIPETFDRILDNIRILVDYKMNFNVAVMRSFSSDKNVARLQERLKEISPAILENFEDEYVFLYPHVIRRLKNAGIQPIIAYTPQGIPKHLI